MKRIYLNNSKPLNFVFEQNEDDFFVEEFNSIKFKGKGNFVILKIKKTNMTTFNLINLLAKILQTPTNTIGYSGLKDKSATTIQYISIPKNCSKELEKLTTSRVQILQSFLHNEKISIGSHDGNNFRINLKNVNIKEIGQIEKRIKHIKKFGIPNYFGYQRFGKNDDNFQKSKDVIRGERIIKDKKMEKIMVSGYQSSYFNNWLCKRVQLANKDSSKIGIINGDIMVDLNTKKQFSSKNLEKLNNDFDEKLISPTGLLPGRDVFRSRFEARKIEEKYDDLEVDFKGDRRAAWIFPTNLDLKYNKEQMIATISFTLPTGSYATVLLEDLGNKILG